VLDIEENLLDSRVEPFHYPHAKAEAKIKVSNNSAPDLISLLTQKIDQMNTQFTQVQNHIMGRLPCQEPHREDECPQRDEDSPNDMNFMDMICVFQEEQVTQEHINEARRRGERI
jgi:hypothetical protein